MPELAVLIPARNEMFLARTIADVLAHAETEIQVLVGLDGAWADPPIADDPRVVILHVSESIGQRAMTNQLCRLTSAKYVMKLDAHCALDQGFDRKLLADMRDDWAMAPTMRNLHAFDWVCPNRHRRYQGPSGSCRECGEETVMDVVWIAKRSPNSTSFCFDSEPHFQYFGDFKKRPEGKGDLTPSMSLQGSCFLLTRERYWALNICDEALGSWGSQGIEVACKTWLSGGTVMVSHKTWYAHMFRTQGGDFGFPYHLPGSQVDRAKQVARDLFFGNTWPQQVRPLSWLLKRFWPVPGWTDAQLAEQVERESVVQSAAVPAVPAEPELDPESSKPPLSRGILYYTDNALNMRMAQACRRTIAAAGLPITSVTLKPTRFGRNIVYPGERSYKTMFQQIEAGLAAMTEDVVYFCEHDVLYHPSHFDFVPSRRDCFYYNGNWWMVRLSDGFAVSYDLSPLAGLVVDRQAALTHFRERNAMIAAKGFGYWMGFEPMTHRRVRWENWYDFAVYRSVQPNVDLAHGHNLTQKRFSQQRFIRKPKFWQESYASHIPGWPRLPDMISAFRDAN
jgi:hypothetical protein